MAHKLFVVVSFVLLITSQVFAQDGVLSCGAPNNSDGSVVYCADLSRVKNPLEVRIATGTWYSSSVNNDDGINRVKGMSFWSLFQKAIPNAVDFCIVRVKVTAKPDSDLTRFEFLYIPWSEWLPPKNNPKSKAEKEP